ncbi:WD repeat-containing protein 65 [Phytophthora cinnamomi]|uniref:WD repeat-containing protein 65 n=1 Tax=Phytophthora cinnamomi TaxID=4785 RepID=UPI003559B334|nr:WD repeat-containing protein 65 [Phytophthora cinnamomi]
MDQFSTRLSAETNYHLLVQELKAAVQRMHEIETEMDDVRLALEDDQEEVETYTDDIADCCDRIEAIDEFVREIQAGNVPTLGDVDTVVANMAEEREEEEGMLKVLGEARTCHAQQLQQLQTQLGSLQRERLMLQKRSSQLWCVLGRNGVFELVIRRLVERTAKVLQ